MGSGCREVREGAFGCYCYKRFLSFIIIPGILLEIHLVLSIQCRIYRHMLRLWCFPTNSFGGGYNHHAHNHIVMALVLNDLIDHWPCLIPTSLRL